MSLGAHFIELRRRLMFAALGILLGAIGGWILSDFILEAMRGPISAIIDDQGRSASMNFTNISEAFDLRFQIAITVGIIISSPVWLYQLWAFIVPGLNKREIKYTVGFVAAAVPLFLLGCAAGWLVLPHMVALLTNFAPEGSSSIISARGYYDFVLKLVVAVGIAFVLPVALVILNFLGVLSARAIIRAWRWAILAITLFCAFATPAADVVSMFLLAIPMVLLYLSAWMVSYVHDRSVARRTKKLEAEFAVMAGDN
jgi:sec-independent protein translocase protein TatC